MKTLLSFITILAITTSCYSQSFFGKKIKGNGHVITKNRSVGSYDKVKVAGSFDVKLTHGKEGKLTIKADENIIPYIITEVENESLKIRFKRGVSIRTRSKLFVTVPFKDIDEVTLSGSGDIFSDDVIESDNLTLKIAGSGDLNLVVKSNNLTSKIAGSGDIEIEGSTTNFTGSIAGSGDIHSYNLISKNVETKISGSGNIEITSTKSIHVRIAGSGSVYYKGNPTFEDIKTSGSGSVRKR